MPGYFDRRDVQTPKSREAALFRDLKGILSFAMAGSPALRRQLDGVDLKSIRTRADIAKIPLIRRIDILAFQQESPPWGGLGSRRPGAIKNVVVLPGPVFIAEGCAKDWWRAARALHAVGARRSDTIFSGFRQSDGAGARIAESGGQALGCATCAIAHCDRVSRLDVLRRIPSPIYFGPQKVLLDIIHDAGEAGIDPFPIRKALLARPGFELNEREAIANLEIDARLCYLRDELGVIAFQSCSASARKDEDLVVNEGLIVETVDPSSGRQLPFGATGEIVVSRIDPEFPLLRYATGDFGRLSSGPSPCGRTNHLLRLARASERPHSSRRLRPATPLELSQATLTARATIPQSMSQA